MCHSMHVEARRQLVVSVLSFHLYMGSGNQTEAYTATAFTCDEPPH